MNTPRRFRSGDTEPHPPQSVMHHLDTRVTHARQCIYRGFTGYSCSAFYIPRQSILHPAIIFNTVTLFLSIYLHSTKQSHDLLYLMATTNPEVLRLNDTEVSISPREAEWCQIQPPSTTLSESTESNTPTTSESALENDSQGSDDESELHTCSAIRK